MTIEEAIRKIVDHPDVLKRDADFAMSCLGNIQMATELEEVQAFLNLCRKYDVIKVTRGVESDWNPEDDRFPMR